MRVYNGNAHAKERANTRKFILWLQSGLISRIHGAQTGNNQLCFPSPREHEEKKVDRGEGRPRASASCSSQINNMSRPWRRGIDTPLLPNKGQTAVRGGGSWEREGLRFLIKPNKRPAIITCHKNCHDSICSIPVLH